MATIITRGVPPNDEVTWFADQPLVCGECATVFTIDRRDANDRNSGWQASNEHIQGQCPMCGAELTYLRDELLVQAMAKARSTNGNPGG